MTDKPTFEDFERLLKSRPQSNVTVKTGTVLVTVSPKYQLVDLTIDAKGLDEAQRKALQDDLVKAVNEAIQTAVLAVASALDALPPPSGLDALKAALKIEVDKSGC